MSDADIGRFVDSARAPDRLHPDDIKAIGAEVAHWLCGDVARIHVSLALLLEQSLAIKSHPVVPTVVSALRDRVQEIDAQRSAECDRRRIAAEVDARMAQAQPLATDIGQVPPEPAASTPRVDVQRVVDLWRQLSRLLVAPESPSAGSAGGCAPADRPASPTQGRPR